MSNDKLSCTVRVAIILVSIYLLLSDKGDPGSVGYFFIIITTIPSIIFYILLHIYKEGDLDNHLLLNILTSAVFYYFFIIFVSFLINKIKSKLSSSKNKENT